MSETIASPNRDYYYGIDVIRFIAALIVAGFHIGFSVWAIPTSGLAALRPVEYHLEALQSALWFGWVGVEVFFVISGVVIGQTVSGKSPFAFLRSRIIRLYPAVWIASSITFIVSAVSAIYSPFDLFRRFCHSIFLIPLHPWIDPVYWTLAVEIAFYGLIFLLVSINRARLAFVVLFIITIFSVFYHGWQAFFILTKGTSIDIPLQLTRLTLIDHASFFFLGLTISRIGTSTWHGRYILAVIIAILCANLEIFGQVYGVLRDSGGFRFVSPWTYAVPFIIWNGSLLCIFLSVIHFRSFSKLPPYQLSIVRSMGAATYPLYLLHFTSGVWIAGQLTGAGVASEAAFLLALGFVVLMSFGISRLAEPPLRRWLATQVDTFGPRLSRLRALAWMFSSTGRTSQGSWR